MNSNTNDKLAVLIDADNAQASPIHELLEEVSRYGTASVKRAYGDWSTPQLKKWKEELHTHAIKPVQQFAYTKGKNSTDSALIIDAMDLLHTGDLNGFCLVSSDSDFTPLAARIREAGLVVYGFGERKTPQPFVAACDKFIYTDILKPPATKAAETKAKAPSPKKKLRGPWTRPPWMTAGLTSVPLARCCLKTTRRSTPGTTVSGNSLTWSRRSLTWKFARKRPGPDPVARPSS